MATKLSAVDYDKKELFHTVISEVIEKATDKTGMDKINRIEKGLVRAIAKAWNGRATSAIIAASKWTGDSAFTKADGRVALKRIEEAFKGIEGTLSKRVHADIAEVYKTHKRRFWERFELEAPADEQAEKRLLFKTYRQVSQFKYKVTKKVVTSIRKDEDKPPAPIIVGVSFSVVDEKLIQQLGKLAVISIGDHMPNNLKPGVLQNIMDAIVQRGLPKKEAGEFLKSELSKRLGGNLAGVPLSIRQQGQASINNYFEGLATHNVTFARNSGAVLAMQEAGIARYVWASIIDQTTTPICQTMDGRSFELRYAVEQINRILEAGSVAELKEIAPFRTEADSLVSGLGKESPTAEQVLAANGVLMPPIHWRCRSDVHPE